MKNFTLLTEVEKMKSLISYKKGVVVSEQGPAGYFYQQLSNQPWYKKQYALNNWLQQKIAQNFKVGLPAQGTEQTGHVYIEVEPGGETWGFKPNGEFGYFSNINDGWKWQNPTYTGTYSDQAGSLTIRTSDGDSWNSGLSQWTGVPGANPSQPAASQPAASQTPQIPSQLADSNGVKTFQDWLDQNKPGWATGFPEGKLNKARGYGRFGPRTTKAWASYGTEYTSGTGPNQNVIPGAEVANAEPYYNTSAPAQQTPTVTSAAPATNQPQTQNTTPAANQVQLPNEQQAPMNPDDIKIGGL